MARPQTCDWHSVLRAAKTRGISMATVSEEQNVTPAAVAKACRRHKIVLADGRVSRWCDEAVVRTHIRKPPPDDVLEARAASRTEDRSIHDDAVLQVSQIDLAYMAGLVDGEGCITISRHAAGGASRTPSFTAQLIVTSTTPALVNWPHARFGGATHRTRSAARPDHHRDTLTWRVGGRRAAAVLAAIRPYLILKGGQADLAIRLQDHVDRHDSRERPGILEEREAMHREIMAMHADPEPISKSHNADYGQLNQ